MEESAGPFLEVSNQKMEFLMDGSTRERVFRYSRPKVIELLKIMLGIFFLQFWLLNEAMFLSLTSTKKCIITSNPLSVCNHRIPRVLKSIPIATTLQIHRAAGNRRFRDLSPTSLLSLAQLPGSKSQTLQTWSFYGRHGELHTWLRKRSSEQNDWPFNKRKMVQRV